MHYRQVLQVVDSEKALQLLEVGYIQSGGYLIFDCPRCQSVSTAKLKIYGDTKNLFYCTACKKGDNIISLVGGLKDLGYEQTIEFLVAKAVSESKQIVDELKLDYELVYSKYLEQKGLSKEICESLGIGVPKGKTMLAGCATFTISDSDGMKIAYYGIRMKDGNPIFHKSFNPEHYLYNFHAVNKEETIYFTTDIFECVKKIEAGIPAICNFGLPYLSSFHLSLLNKVEKTIFKVEDKLINSIAVQLAQFHKQLYKFEH